MRRLSAALGALFLFVCSGLCATADDASIARDLSKLLRQAKADGELQDFKIGVKVDAGVVWLSGNVASENQRDLTLEIARRVPQVRLVVNDLTVGAEPQGGQSPTTRPEAEEPMTEPDSELAPTTEIRRSDRVRPGNRSNQSAENRAPERRVRVSNRVAQLSTPDPDVVRVPADVRDPQPVPIDLTRFQQPAPVTATRTGHMLAPGGVEGAAVPAYVQMVPVMPYPVAAVPTGNVAAIGQAPVPARSNRPVPVAMARGARQVSYCGDGGCAPGAAGTLMGPMGGFDGAYGGAMDGGYSGDFGGSYSSTGVGVPVAESGGYQGGPMYDNPQMPGYAWPSYASYPNYAAVTYPKQYSPMAWPYIGPFYPYPQVPLGWRKVCLEWDDGWWMLDFKAK